MRFSEDFLNELKDRIRLSDYVGRSVKLVRSGKHMKGLSPFKPEKTPSFFVDDDKRSFNCYATGVHGDLISYVQEVEGLDFTETVKKLAELAGMELPTRSPQERQVMRRRKSLQELMEATVAFYEAQLRSDVGALARDYLQRKRGLDANAWARHRIGYAPEGWQYLRDHLVNDLGAKDDELIEIGVTRPSNKPGKPPYDAFRHRVIFPILDASGKPVALGGRALEPSEVLKERGIPKYVNSAETPLFRKSATIYGFGPARDALHRASREGDANALSRGLVLVEGYMDVIALVEHGFPTAVAPMGTALTEDQLQMLWRVGPEPIMCFDGDSAGVKAAHRAVDLALPMLAPGRSIYFTFLPQGLDPDDLLKTDGGAEKMRALLLGARPLADILWERELAKETPDTPERKAGLEARLFDLVGQIDHEQVKTAYRREVKDRLYRLSMELRQASRDDAWKAGRNASMRRGGAGVTPEMIKENKDRPGLGLLCRAIETPLLIEEARDALVIADFSDPDVSAIRDAMLDLQDSTGKLDRGAVSAHLRSLGRTRSVKLLDEYPRTEPIDLDTAEGRRWLEALERFPTVAALRVEAGESIAEAFADGVDEFAVQWERRKRLVAERQALKASAREDGEADDHDAA